MNTHTGTARRFFLIVDRSQPCSRWVFQYNRCRTCGFALRVILPEIPDAALPGDLRQILANSFVRNVPA